MIIRLATPNEIPIIKSYGKKVQEEATVGYLTQNDEIPTKETYFWGESYYFVLVNHDHICGWVLVGDTYHPFKQEPTGMIIELYVLPNYRNYGFGQQLMAAALKHFKYKGYKTVQLNVFAGNPAKKMYEKLGFRDVSTAMEIHF
ncbi:GNAT family N-acetyltransferase [Bacillus salitolerans]|uniref:GNAT family N-acetyltransferase n=1 Tax=Bacillus salitolerans TaxID=1437434 RepID=A0ABW4LS58_9BACI